jgi:hypothetical protein
MLPKNGLIVNLCVRVLSRIRILLDNKLDKVGFDLVNVQLPLKMVDPSIADRIQWMHGNLYVLSDLPVA